MRPTMGTLAKDSTHRVHRRTFDKHPFDHVRPQLSAPIVAHLVGRQLGTSTS